MEKKKTIYVIHSGKSAIESDVPEVAYIIEQKLRHQAKIAVIGKWKTAKSFLTIQLGMAIASGNDFLGFKTTQANVLYVNFEISEEMFAQRIQDMNHALNYNLDNFNYLTITDLSLDLHTQELEEILTQCITEGFNVEVLIIDPRWKAVKRDSNQDEVINAFCTHLDQIIQKYKLAVIVVHHEGASTSSDKAGKGSTVFDAWLDGWFKIKPQSLDNKVREIDVWSRDSERETITAIFKYPIHEVSSNMVAERKAKTDKAKLSILEFINSESKPEKDVRFYVLGKGHTDYAYWRARAELLKSGLIEITKASGAGNRKIISYKNNN
jgi:RecA-family ATPase